VFVAAFVLEKLRENSKREFGVVSEAYRWNWRKL